MFASLKNNYVAWLVGGLVLGWSAGSGRLADLHTPLHAVATDRHENYAVATGWVDENVEAVFFLDFLTGTLKAAVLNVRQGPGAGQFTTIYEQNVLADMKIDASKTPRFLMVTGGANFPAGGAGRGLGKSVVYVVEVTSGRLVAYGLPWVTGNRPTPPVGKAPLVKLSEGTLRPGLVRE